MVPAGETASSAFVIGCDVGVVGRWLRLLLGLVSASAIAWDLVVLGRSSVVPVVAVALFFTLALGVYMAAYRLLARTTPWIRTMLLIGPLVAVLALDLGPTTLRHGLVLYIAVSLIVTFFLRYGGCEIVAIPTFIFGNRYPVYCPVNVVDVVERDLRTKTR